MRSGKIHPYQFAIGAIVVFVLIFAPIRTIAEDTPVAEPTVTVSEQEVPSLIPEPTTSSPSLSPTLTSTPTPTSTPPQQPPIIEENIAESLPTSTAESLTGNDIITSPTISIASDSSAIITTGTAIAVAENIQIINSSIANSQISFPVIVVGSSTTQETINLNTYWKNMQQAVETNAPPASSQNVIINTTEASALVSAIANTGENIIKAPTMQTVIVTGDALAVAQLVTLANMNIQSSTIFNGSIIIFGNYSGDIIVPNISRFFERGISTVSSIPHTIPLGENIAKTHATTASTAVTGENSQLTNTGEINTGTASSQAISQTYANSVIDAISQYEISINTLEFWKESNNLMNNTSIIVPAPYIKNTAEVDSVVSAYANTGNNTAEGSQSYINTGSAFSLATTLEYINSHIFNSSLFHPIITVFGDWTGSLIEAKPDIAVTLSEDRQKVNSGDITTYSILVENRGHETARNVKGSIALPNKERVIDGDISFSLPSVEVGEKKLFSLRTILDSLPNEKILTTYAQVETTDQEYATANNQSTVSKDVVQPPLLSQGVVSSEAQQEADNRLPNLLVRVKHNVGTHVLAGDIITYEIEIENIGEGVSFDTVLLQDILNADYNVLTSQIIPFHTISPHSRKSLTFGLQLPQNIDPAFYLSQFTAEGYAPNSTIIQSSPFITSFYVGERVFYSQSNASVLGSQTVKGMSLPKKMSSTSHDKGNTITPIHMYFGICAVLIFLQQLGRYVSNKLQDPDFINQP